MERKALQVNADEQKKFPHRSEGCRQVAKPVITEISCNTTKNSSLTVIALYHIAGENVKICSLLMLVYVQIKTEFYRHFQSSKRPKLRVLQRWQTITEFAQKTIMGFAKEQILGIHGGAASRRTSFAISG